MAGPTQLDRTFPFVVESFPVRGHAPHHTGIARRLGVGPPEGSGSSAR